MFSSDRLFGRITEFPAAVHSALQEAGQSVLTYMELGRMAGQDAAAHGLTGQAFVDEVARLMAEPRPGWTDTAEGVAKRVVLRGDLGGLGQMFANLAGQGPGTPGYSRYSIGNALFPVFH